MKSILQAALAAVILAAPVAVAQTTAAPRPTAAPWKPFQEFESLVGSWSGTAESNQRIGGRVARFAMELGGSFLVHRGSTIFAAADGKPEEATEEVGFWSYDRTRRKYVASYWFSTGVYGTYDVEIGADGTIRLASTQLSNYEDGGKARMTFTRTSERELGVSLELAPSGQAFVPFVTSKLTRK